jgi:formiminotetrahydrofolate cyclodeaminase
MLGHTKLSTTQIYAKVLDTKVSHDMGALKSILAAKQKPKDSESNQEFSDKKLG